MPTEILAVGTTLANSSDVVVDVGETLTVCLKDAAGAQVGRGARVDVLLKDDDGEYFLVDSLSSSRLALLIVAPGTYRFTRQAGVSCGVFSG